MDTRENTPFFHASVIRCSKWARRCEPEEILDPEGHPSGARKPDPSAAFCKDIDGLACVLGKDPVGGPNPGRGGVDQRVCIGAGVFVCDNFSFQGAVTFEWKHTAGMLRDLSWMMSETISMLPTRFAAQAATFETCKRRGLSHKDVHDLAIRFCDASALGARSNCHTQERSRGQR